MIDKLNVFIEERKVGTLALLKDNRVAFEYEDTWLLNGYSISPFSLPLEKKVFIPNYNPFFGLFGVFSDSLPDGWGKLLVDRMLKQKHIDLNKLNILERLAIVGNYGSGALSYRPAKILDNQVDYFDLDEIAKESRNLLNDKDTKDLDLLFKMGGSSGGAKPKLYISYNDEKWIIKFPSHMDPVNIGEQEYHYMLCAKRCGLDIPEIKLFSSKLCTGYFGSKRFDRNVDNLGKEKRIFMISAGALLETSHRIPNLDYHQLMKLTSILTKDFNEIVKMYRLMCFNVFSHNRDDHAKNFSYIYLNEKKCWKLSPVYDLTYSNSLHGEHATTINGNGMNPSLNDLVEVGAQGGICKSKAVNIANEIKSIVEQELKDYVNQKDD